MSAQDSLWSSPGSLGKLEGQLLHAQGQRVTAFRGHGRVGDGMDQGFDHVFLGERSASLRLPGPFVQLRKSAQDRVRLMFRTCGRTIEADISRKFINEEVDARH